MGKAAVRISLLPSLHKLRYYILPVRRPPTWIPYFRFGRTLFQIFPFRSLDHQNIGVAEIVYLVWVTESDRIPLHHLYSCNKRRLIIGVATGELIMLETDRSQRACCSRCTVMDSSHSRQHRRDAHRGMQTACQSTPSCSPCRRNTCRASASP